MVPIRPLSLIGCALAAALLSPFEVLGETCPRFDFPRQDNIADWVNPSLSKVYRTATGNTYQGTATVVDETGGLALTASHVADNDKVFLLFPSLRDDIRHPATVIARLRQSNKESSGESWGQARDLAILKLDTPVPSIIAAEVWLGQLDTSETLHFFGFNSDSESAVHGTSKSSIPKPKTRGPDGADCTRHVREATESGDSGAPVFDQNGLINGIMIARKNAGRAGKFIPSRCFADFLITALGTARAQSSLSKIAGATKGAAITMLKPPRRQDWVSNIELAAAIDTISETDDLKPLISHHACPLRPATLQRGMGYDRYDKYVGAKQKWELAQKRKKPKNKTAQLKNTRLKETAEQLHRDATYFIQKKNRKVGATLLTAAVKAYDTFIVRETFTQPIVISIAPSIMGGGVTSGMKPYSPPIRSPTNQREIAQSKRIGQAYKAQADMLIQLADLRDDADILTKAQQSAAQAVSFATDAAAKADAYAALGAASQKAGHFQAAIEAYSAAADAGNTSPWVRKNYNWAFQNRDNVKSPTLSEDYRKVGDYKKIDDSLIDFYANRGPAAPTTGQFSGQPLDPSLGQLGRNGIALGGMGLGGREM